MKIIKYSKIGSNKYNAYLEDGTKILLYEDVILKNELLIKKEIDNINDLLKQNSKYEIFDLSIKYINHKLRSIKEMREYLVKNSYDNKDIDLVINELISRNYLNDELYSKCYINDRINLSNDGPLKIRNYLDKQNISEEIYQKYLDLFDKELIYEKINKYINKMIKVNKKSQYVLKNKIMLNLINLGYYKEDINYCLGNIKVDDSNNYEKDKKKLHDKLKKKYSGIELERKLKEKLYQMGYVDYERIN